MKKIISFLLTLFCACGILIGNVGAASPAEVAHAEAQAVEAAETGTEKIDYAGRAVLNLDGDSKTLEAKVKIFIDGDTTHFYVEGWNSENLYKARYAAVNTPESTGQLEPWGKKAANFTRSKLENATSIIIESDGTDWEPDSTGDRYLSWIWYKAPDSDTYRNLNLELLQEGLAVGSKATDSRYGELATLAIAQATELKLHVFSQEKDPNFFYGSSIEIDLKELRLNIEYYEGKRVAFEGVVSYYEDHSVYVEDFDEETQMYYGIYIFYGYNMASKALQYLSVGNRLRITGVVTYYEAGDSYQVSDLKYNAYKPTDDDLRLLEKGHSAANVETTAATFASKVPVNATFITGVDKETNEPITTTETKNINYAELALNTSISMKGLYVKSAYTTQTGGDNDGAMTLTCQSDGKTIKVRTPVLRDPTTNALVTQDAFIGKTIDVTGVVDYFSGDYQIKILHSGAIKVNGEPLFKPVVPTPPATETPSESPEEKGCGSIVANTALLPLAAVVVLFVKKRKD